jgi:uncharacterized protein
MEKIEYIGKCLLIEEKNEKCLVVGDIHLGYSSDESMGAIINKKLFDEMIGDFDSIFEKVGKVDKIILLGDLKHEFSILTQEERYGIVNLIDYLKEKSKMVIIIKGNHDNYLINIIAKRNIKIQDYYVWEKYCFLHGDRDFIENYSEEVKYWIMGHIHPAIKLKEGIKIEKYKCFLYGDFQDKKVIILPSFSEGGGVDAREIENVLPWKFDLNNFEVFVVGENLEVLDFGKLKKIN